MCYGRYPIEMRISVRMKQLLELKCETGGGHEVSYPRCGGTRYVNVPVRQVSISRELCPADMSILLHDYIAVVKSYPALSCASLLIGTLRCCFVKPYAVEC